MRGSFGTKTITGLLLAFGLALGACGGGAQEQREPDWRPRERVPTVAEHWWHEPVERACEEDADCERGERCRTMRLGTCSNCPPGEQAKICVGDGEQAPRRAQAR